MTGWASIEWFDWDDIVRTDAETGSLGGTVSGVSPAINLDYDYYLRDENGETVTDENGDILSMEGLSIA